MKEYQITFERGIPVPRIIGYCIEGSGVEETMVVSADSKAEAQQIVVNSQFVYKLRGVKRVEKLKKRSE